MDISPPCGVGTTEVKVSMHIATATTTTTRNRGNDDDDDYDNNNNNNKRANLTIFKLFRKYLYNVPGKHKVKELQKSAILSTVHILRKC
jgi:hypothetical protein